MANSSIKNLAKDAIGLLYYNFYKRFFKKKGNRALIYHAFGSKLKHDTYGISIGLNDFKKQLAYFKENYQIKGLNERIDQDSSSISITIDDGYKDTVEAVNILADMNIPFTLFITTNFIDTNQYLTKKDIFDISKLNNSTIGSHGTSHRKLGLLTYDEQLNELSKSKDILQSITGKEIISASYPHGSFNNDTIKILNLLKYRLAASSIKGINTSSTNKFLLHRSEIIKGDRLTDINKKIKGYYDYY